MPAQSASQPLFTHFYYDKKFKSGIELTNELKKRGLPYWYTGLRNIKILRLLKDDADKRRAIHDKQLSEFNDENDEDGALREALRENFRKQEHDFKWNSVKADFEAARKDLEEKTALLAEAMAELVEADAGLDEFLRRLRQEQDQD